MVLICAAVGCGNKSGKIGLSFYRFPKVNHRLNDATQELQKQRREAWKTSIKRMDLNDEKCKFTRVCSAHFLSGKPANLFELDNPDWSPSLLLGYDQRGPKKSLDRYKRAKKRETRLIEPVSTSFPDTDLPGAEDVTISESSLSVSTQTSVTELTSQAMQTDLTGGHLTILDEQLATSNQERVAIRQRLQAYENTQEDFQRNPKKLKFYTGLTNIAMFTVILNIISPFISVTVTSSLDAFQQLLLTMMKLRLNLSFTDLGYRFHVSRYTASRVFHSVLEVLFVRLKKLIIWPERENLRETMPLCFKEFFGNSVVIIIDCFELFTEKPGNLKATCQTWSTYKHHQTVKYLIGICPQGSISFISKGYGGRASDKFITEDCGILKNLLPGDSILADRGFNITEEVAMYCATVKLPAFTKGKPQLHPKEIEDTRHIASVRIHVERVIGLIKQKYKVLHQPVATEMLSNEGAGSTIDKIVHVCCSLTNLCESVIPFE